MDYISAKNAEKLLLSLNFNNYETIKLFKYLFT